MENEPVFLKSKTLPENYYSLPDPYRSFPSCHVDLLNLSRYAKEHDKKLVDLTEAEIELFKISK